MSSSPLNKNLLLNANLSPIAKVDSPVASSSPVSNRGYSPNSESSVNKGKLKTARKVLSFPDTTPIYLYKGHGTDLCDENGPIIGKVPENCIYITFAVCGNPTYFNVRELELFSSRDPAIKEIIAKPYITENRKKLAKLLGISADDIILRFPGDTCVYNTFEPLSWWFNKTITDNYFWKLTTSGLLEKNLLEAKADPFFFNFELVDTLTKSDYTKYDKEYIETAKAIPFSDISYLKYKRDLAHKLLKMFKINFPTKTEYTKDEIRAVFNSFLSYDLPKYFLEDGRFMAVKLNDIENEFFKNPQFAYTKDELQKKIIGYLTTTPAYHFSKLYDCSIYPTRSHIESILQTNNIKQVNAQNIVDVRNVIVSALGTNPKDLFNPESTLTNIFMMHQFPGIHYNTVCRSVSKECEALAIPRRTMSELQFQNVQRHTNIVLGKELEKPENILYKDPHITIVKPGTLGSVPLVGFFAYEEDSGSCDTSIKLGSDSLYAPTNPIPDTYDEMDLDARILALYGKTRQELADEKMAQKVITIDVDPNTTYVFDGYYMSKRMILSDYLKNPSYSLPHIFCDMTYIPGDWLSSCYENEGVMPIEPMIKSEGFLRGFIADFEQNESKKAEVNQARKNLNAWNSYKKEVEAFKRNKSKFKNTKKYGGKRKLLKKKRRTYKK